MQTNKCKHVQQSSRVWLHHFFTWFYCRAEKLSQLPQAEESKPAWRTWLPAINHSQHVYWINLHVLSHLKIALGVNSRCTFTKVPLMGTHTHTHTRHESPSCSRNDSARLHQSCLWPICREREGRWPLKSDLTSVTYSYDSDQMIKFVYWSRFPFKISNPAKEITWTGPLLQPQPVMWSQNWKIFTYSQVKKALNHNIIYYNLLDWGYAGERDCKTMDFTGSPLPKTLSLCFGLDLVQIL